MTLLPSVINAEFPSCSVVSTFNVADENPVSESGKWAYGIRGTHTNSNSQRIVSNKLATNTSGPNTGESYWTPSTSLYTDTYITMAALPTDNNNYTDLFVRIQVPNTVGMDAYYLEWTLLTGSTDTWTFNKYINESFSAIGTFGTRDLVAGEKIGLRIFDDSFNGAQVTGQAYVCTTAGVWSRVGVDVTDTASNRVLTVGNGGIGLSTINSPGRVSEYGFGEIAETVTPSFLVFPKEMMRNQKRMLV